MKAFKLINSSDSQSSFQKGYIPEMEKIDATYFMAQTDLEIQSLPHPAPRYQFVITLKGKLRFTVGNGTTFDIEPGVILVAKDLNGAGHSWKIIEGNEWHRIYIVPHSDAEDHFHTE